MAKSLSERIAERVQGKKATAGAQNRGAFLALKNEIAQALADRWPVKTIWETLHDEGKIGFSYQAFRNYVNSLIPPSDRGIQPGPPIQVEPSRQKKPEPTQTRTQQKPAESSQATVPRSTPKAPTTGFNFESKPNKEDYI